MTGMIKKTIALSSALVLTLSILLSLSSCGIVMDMAGKTGSADMIEYEGRAVSQGMIKYTFARMRSIGLESYKSMEEFIDIYGSYLGYEPLGVKVEDTDEFWNSVYVYADKKGTTFADHTKENAVNFLKNALIVESLVKKYSFVGISEESEQKIKEQKEEMIKLYGSEDRFKIELAAYPITVEEWEWWERSMVLITEFKSWLYGKGGPIELTADDFYICVKPIEFYYEEYETDTAETDGTADDTAASGVTESTENSGTETIAETTAETETQSSEDQLSDETDETDTEKSFSEEAKEKALSDAEKLRDSLINGEKTVDEAYAETPFLTYYPTGIPLPYEQFYNAFGLKDEDLKPGDVVIGKAEYGVLVFCVCEISEEKRTELMDPETNSDITTMKNTEINKRFAELIEVLSKDITYLNDAEYFLESLKITDFKRMKTAETTIPAESEG